MPSLDAFVESLIQEKDKLVQMGVIQTSKNQALDVGLKRCTRKREAQREGDKKH